MGIDGIETGIRRAPGGTLTDRQKTLNAALSAVRSNIERAIAHLKNWRVLKTGYRGPIDGFDQILRTVTALHHYAIQTIN